MQISSERSCNWPQEQHPASPRRLPWQHHGSRACSTWTQCLSARCAQLNMMHSVLSKHALQDLHAHVSLPATDCAWLQDHGPPGDMLADMFLQCCQTHAASQHEPHVARSHGS